MKQKKMLALTFSQLKQIYNQEIPEVVEIADKSSSVEEFKAGMLRFLEICRIENEAAEEAREQIRLLLDYDGQNVHELSTGQDMSVQTIRLLYEFLTGTLENMEIVAGPMTKWLHWHASWICRWMTGGFPQTFSWANPVIGSICIK